MKRIGIFLIVAALVGGMAGCFDRPCKDLEIRDWYDLHAVRSNLEGNYRLMNNLDATTAGYEELASPMANEGKGWKPIGYRSGAAISAFTGVFDGQGYEIRDLYIDRPDEDSVGLFGVVSGSKSVEDGIVANVGVVNATVTGSRHVGALVGFNHILLSLPGTVTNSYSTGSVTGDEYVGGLVGSNAAGTVTGSHSVTNVTGQYFVGGLVGMNWEGTVINCYATGNVTGADWVGGLVGSNEEGTVSGSYSVNSVTGQYIVGGLVGHNPDGIVTNSYSAGSVTGHDYVGGLVGRNGRTVRSSYSSASVSGDSRDGGLAGSNEDTVVDSQSTGSVTGTAYVGGLVAVNEGTVSDSFWDVEASGMEESDGGTGKTTTEMKDIATFIDTETEGLDRPWDITAVTNDSSRDLSCIWNTVDGETYPFLSWQSIG